MDTSVPDQMNLCNISVELFHPLADNSFEKAKRWNSNKINVCSHKNLPIKKSVKGIYCTGGSVKYFLETQVRDGDVLLNQVERRNKSGREQDKNEERGAKYMNMNGVEW